MKTSPDFQAINHGYPWNGSSGFSSSDELPSKIFPFRQGPGKESPPGPKIYSDPLLTEDARAEMERGAIPDLEQVCRDLFDTLLQHRAPYSALQFLPVLKKISSIRWEEAERFMRNPKTNHVLVRNDLIKVVLIHWTPGKVTDIHGHPQGGCMFKVLKGRLEERRYSPDKLQWLLSVSTLETGSLAYIDDEMAYHAVRNPFESSAISLHVYTPGN